MRGTLHNTISDTKNCFRKKSFFPLCSKWYEWRYPNELVVFLWGKMWIEFSPQSELDLQTTIQWGVGRQGFLPNLVKICINGELIYRPSTIKEVRGSTKWRFTSSPESNSDLKQNVAQILSCKVSNPPLFCILNIWKVILKIKFRKLSLQMWAIFFLWSNICLWKDVSIEGPASLS